MYHNPSVISASTNRNLLQPTRENRQRRKSRIEDIQASADKGKHRDSASSGEASSSKKSHIPVIGKLLRHASASTSSSDKSDRSQLVDLVVEDQEAEEIERVRARKEGSPAWNETDPKHYV